MWHIELVDKEILMVIFREESSIDHNVFTFHDESSILRKSTQLSE